jgi:hypothetical protein
MQSGAVGCPCVTSEAEAMQLRHFESGLGQGFQIKSRCMQPTTSIRYPVSNTPSLHYSITPLLQKKIKEQTQGALFVVGAKPGPSFL